MTDLAAIFDFPAITELHRTRTQSIGATLHATTTSPLDLTHPALAYALAHHCLEGAEHAARQRDSRQFRWYRDSFTKAPQRWLESTTHGPTVIQAPPAQLLLRSELAETPYYLLSPETQPASTQLTRLTSEALDIAHDCGFGALVSRHAPVVCLLQAKDPTGTLDSWTISRLPGTVFLDYTGDPYLLARDIIHEASHNWLNDALAATGTVIADSAGYYSPWKRTTRPAFGFLHACWAFPLTMLFSAAASTAPQTPPPTREHLRTYTHQQHAKLSATATDHPHALALIDDRELRGRLHEIHTTALHLEPVDTGA
ncbi:HEXXH motif-containing putative peptide modification protein [Nocardia sp. NPDC006044]|uniref:aKG-HExxH-type peptide beta-hydroxylase n=1 Tax=Nocardia sp. NPDC006044 TaxID=3364306 RepID=UPI0036B630A0